MVRLCSSYHINMINYPDLKKGVTILLDKEPYEILEAIPIFKGRGHSTLKARLKNLVSSTVISKTFHPSDSFEEPELNNLKMKFLYSHKGQYFFSEESNPSQRFSLSGEKLGPSAQFLKSNQTVEGLFLGEKFVNISLPIKVSLKVVEAPPGFKGGRAEAGTKQVTLETGAKINIPLFIKEGDIIELNTETGEYVRRVE